MVHATLHLVTYWCSLIDDRIRASELDAIFLSSSVGGNFTASVLPALGPASWSTSHSQFRVHPTTKYDKSWSTATRVLPEISRTLWYVIKLLCEYLYTSSTPTCYLGEKKCTMNVHILSHLANCVKNWGPIWCYSCFPFESRNADLKRLFHGSRDMSHQVRKSHSDSGIICYCNV